jgi:phenylpropionate dioxygenase-like ring-hydroxylating dioxygenase large terminal subunit
VRTKAYRTHERNGVIWAYLGSRETPPDLPELEANLLGEEDCMVTVLHRANNWMQGWEGEMDTVHAAFLHGGATRPEDTEPGSLQYYEVKTRNGKFVVKDTEVGVSYGMYRVAEEDSYYWRVGHMLFPCFAMVPPGPLGQPPSFIAYVPMDDYHTLEWGVFGRPRERGAVMAGQGGVTRGRRTAGIDREYVANGTGWYDRFNITQNLRNDFLIDREAQRNWESYTGIRGIRQQDMAMTETMGPIMNRSREHLGTTDALIIRTRRKLIASAKALAEHGIAPPGVETPQAYHQRSGGIVLPRSVDWWEATRDLREKFEAGTKQVEVPA